MTADAQQSHVGQPGPPRGQVLSFASDIGTRRAWFVPESMGHLAKLHLGLLTWLVARYTAPGDQLPILLGRGH
jgi:hypothetical protein